MSLIRSMAWASLRVMVLRARTSSRSKTGGSLSAGRGEVGGGDDGDDGVDDSPSSARSSGGRRARWALEVADARSDGLVRGARAAARHFVGPAARTAGVRDDVGALAARAGGGATRGIAPGKLGGGAGVPGLTSAAAVREAQLVNVKAGGGAEAIGDGLGEGVELAAGRGRIA